MLTEEKINIYEEVKGIREHFEKQLLSKLYHDITNISWPGNIRNASTHQAEDSGFEVAKQEVFKIIDNLWKK